LFVAIHIQQDFLQQQQQDQQATLPGGESCSVFERINGKLTVGETARGQWPTQASVGRFHTTKHDIVRLSSHVVSRLIASGDVESYFGDWRETRRSEKCRY